jgi:hypothetical protein
MTLEGNLGPIRARNLNIGDTVMFNPGRGIVIPNLNPGQIYTLKEIDYKGNNSEEKRDMRTIFTLEEYESPLNCLWFKLPE